MEIQEYTPSSISRIYKDISTVVHTQKNRRGSLPETEHLGKVAARITLVAITAMIMVALTVVFNPPQLLLLAIALLPFAYTKNQPSFYLLAATHSIACLFLFPVSLLTQMLVLSFAAITSIIYNGLDNQEGERLPPVLTDNFKKLILQHMPYSPKSQKQ